MAHLAPDISVSRPRAVRPGFVSLGERRLAAEVEDLQLLHSLSLRLAGTADLDALLIDVLRTAATACAADFGSAQLLSPQGDLRMVGQVGFDEDIVVKFAKVSLEDCSTCAVALRRKSRVIVQNLHTDPDFAEIAAALRSYGAVGAVSTPILGSSGDVLAMFSLYWRSECEPTEGDLRILDLCADLAGRHVERSATEKALRTSEQKFRTFVTSAQEGVWAFDAEGHTTFVNDRMTSMLGADPDYCIGRHMQEFCCADDLNLVGTFLDECAAGRGREFELRLRRRDGSELPVLAAMTPLRGDDNAVVGMLGGFIDISYRKDAEARQNILMRELSHRGKNLISVVLAIASRTLSGQRSLEEARSVLVGRLRALANTYNTLTDQAPVAAKLMDIVSAGVESFSDRVRITGAEVMLSAKVAQSLSLMVHELVTNAVKYGALSVPNGRIAVDWEIADQRFRFSWAEDGGPQANPPKKGGFGSVVLNSLVGTELQCQPATEYLPAGLNYRIDAPVTALNRDV